jgi:3-deoxy-D-manno-octulosonic-acid transferase
MSVIYNLLYTLLFPFYLLLFVFITKKKGYSPELKERSVLYSDKKEKTLWFHCASVGELNLSRPLIEHFGSRYEILITVSSPRGKDYAVKNFPEAVVKAVPFDFPFLIKKFIRFYNPEALIVAEGELWYNLINESSKKIPVISINARISPSSYRIYKKLSFFIKKILEKFNLIIVRSKSDYDMLSDFTGKNIVLCGDLKFVSSKIKKKIEFEKKGKILIAGSTHHPEEQIVINIFKKLKKKYPQLKLIIAPRHLERVQEVIEMLKKEKISYSLRTETKRLETDVYIIDTMGELSAFYSYADVVFIGGSISPVGGHNILEAVLQNKPVIIGEHYEKISETVKQLMPEGILKVVKDEKDFEKAVEYFLNKEIDTVDFKKISEKIFECYVSNIEKVLGENNG